MNTSASASPPFIPQMRLYQQWLAEHRQLSFDNYQDLWRWSVTHIEDFWQSAWDYLDLQSPTPHTCVLERNTMPGARWFVGAQVNYAQQVLRHVEQMPLAMAGIARVAEDRLRHRAGAGAAQERAL